VAPAAGNLEFCILTGLVVSQQGLHRFRCQWAHYGSFPTGRNTHLLHEIKANKASPVYLSGYSCNTGSLGFRLYVVRLVAMQHDSFPYFS
jgi:hypothetical protein